MAVALQIALVLVLVVVNGLLAMSEIAVVTARKPRLRRRADGGDARAAAALELAEHPSRLLSTVQIGITLVGILAGAFGGATLAEELARALAAARVPDGWSEPLALGLVVLPITYVNVVLGELVPKRIALADPEAVAVRVARPMKRLAALGRPAVWLLSRSTASVVRLLGIRDRRDGDVTEEDLVALLHQAAEGGVIEHQEQRIVERLFRLSDLAVADLMTPRERIVSVDVDSGELAVDRLEADPHPRYVVTRGADVDEAIGFVDAQDLLLRALRGVPQLTLDDVRDPHWVSPEFPALRLLHLFQASGVHLALVRDGGMRVVGLLTVTDLLEHVVGELPDASEFDERPIVQRDDGSWLVDGGVAIADLRQVLDDVDSARLADVEEVTVAQLVTARAERQTIGPTTVVAFGRLRFEVVDMDWDRIDKVLVVPSSSP
jgi:putative hemolysin